MRNETPKSSYEWYVIENINDPDKRIDHVLPLDEAIRLYAASACGDKRLGVTKDDIAAVDLAIRWNGREWLSEDRLKLDSFKNDPVVADACARIQRMLEAVPAAGLPEKCFAALNTTGEIIVVHRGAKGYTPTGQRPEGVSGQAGADALNEQLGVSKAQAAAMLAGSMFGWTCPGADPANYDEQGRPIRPRHEEE